MVQSATTGQERKWQDSAHASLGLLGTYLKRTGFFTPSETGVVNAGRQVGHAPG